MYRQLSIESIDNLYRIPLLDDKNNELPLTKSEEITSSVRHTVSAKVKSSLIIENWCILKTTKNYSGYKSI